MEIGIIGLPKSGKTTVFNALTGGHALTDVHHGTKTDLNVGVAKVPDKRVSYLTNLYKSKKTTFAEIKYNDITMPKGFGKGESIGGPLLNQMMVSDALVQVVRCFPNAETDSIEGSPDLYRDVAMMELELVMSDLTIVNRKLERLEQSLRGAKSQEREAFLKEGELLERIKLELEKEVPLRKQNLHEAETKSLLGYQFLTQKPLILILNIAENDIGRAPVMESEARDRLGQRDITVTAICGNLEMELSQLSDTESAMFRKELGVAAESALDRFVAVSYKLLGLASFLTTGPDESRAWTIKQGTTAPKAAAKVHSDIEKGFIKAEVIIFDDLVRTGGYSEARKQGLVRLEGREYLVKDGDIINFMFNT